MKTLIAVVALSAASLLFVAEPAQAATVPSGYTDTTIASGLTLPTAMETTSDGRIFVARQGGQVRIIKNGRLLAAPFVTLKVDAADSRGLLGVTVHPNFPATPYVYVYYTVPGTNAHNRVSRFTANGDVAVPGSEVVIAELDKLVANGHNGGAIHFGADGKLYIATGDNKNGANSPKLTNRFGKMLRLNEDGSIPSDNPFLSQTTGGNRAIWARGFRNPFTSAVQPGTGRIFVNDVGENTWEEIDLGKAGGNYGWPSVEGPPPNTQTERPFHAYRHSGSPGGCSIAGGAFYNPASAQFPSAYVGDYFFADFCGGWIYSLDLATRKPTPFASGIANPVDLKVGPDGALYYLSYGKGTVGRITVKRQTFYLNDQNAATGFDHVFGIGTSSGTTLACDWDGDGTDTIGVVTGGRWLLRNSNSAGSPDVSFSYGRSTDVPICGDWDGDGTDTPGVKRGSAFYLRNANSSGSADIAFAYGRATDVPLVGNWDGTPGVGVGIKRGNAYYLTNLLDGGRDIAGFTYGAAGDRPITGDWDGDGADSIGVRRSSTFYLRGADGGGSTSVTTGSSSDAPLGGDWDGDRTATIGLVRTS